LLQKADRLLTSDRREIVEELVEGRPTREPFHKIPGRNAGSDEYRLAADYLGMAVNEV
jgi:hypothetical protein